MRLRCLLLTTPFLINSLLFSQTVCRGSTEQCVQRQKEVCAKEAAPANFHLAADEAVGGVVRDQSGSIFSGEVTMQLRDPKSGSVLRTADVDKNGQFEFGKIDAGTYRLIVVKLEAGKALRLKGFDQPSEVKCASKNGCELVLVPTVHDTDNTIDYCGPK